MIGALRRLILYAKAALVTADKDAPGELQIARAKRKYERKLRAAGHSRTEAMTMVAERFRDRG